VILENVLIIDMIRDNNIICYLNVHKHTK